MAIKYLAGNRLFGTASEMADHRTNNAAAITDGTVFFQDVTNDVYIWNGETDVWDLVSGNSIGETFTTKTFDDHITMQKVSAVGNQATNYGAIYIDTSDGKLYFKYQSAAAVDLTLSGSAVTLAGLSDTAIDGNEAAGHILIYDGTNSWDNKAISGGDASLTAGGVLTVLDGAITGKTELDENPANTDFIVISDTSVSSGDKLRKVTIANLQSDLQPLDTGLTSIAGLTTAADRMIYTTGSDVYAVATLTAAGRSILDDADVGAMRTTLGLGSSDNVTFNNVVVGGTLTVNTTTTVSSTVINVADPLIALANGNAANSVDIGFYGLYVDSGSKYSGLVRDASDGKWKLFTGLTDAPAASTVNAAHGTFGTGTLVATLEGSADTLTTGRNFSIAGDVVASAVSFNGSGAVVLTTAFASEIIVNADIHADAGILDTKLATIDTANKVSLTALDIDGGTALSTVEDADLFIVDDNAAGANKKVTAANLKSYIGSTATAIGVADTSDTTSFVALFESATGDLAPKTDASGITYNAGTGTLTVTALGAVTLSGKLTAGSSEIEGTAFDINGGTINQTDITVESGKTLDVSGGTLTLANDQISGDKVEGGTIAAITISDATITTGNITVGTGKTLTVSSGTLTTSAAQKLAIIQGAASNIDVGAYEIRALKFQSDQATGTAPFTVASTTVVTNLNADLLDGLQGSAYATLAGAEILVAKTLTTPKIVDGGAIHCGTYNSGANELIKFDSVDNAVNEITISNGATGDSAIIAASGETNTGIILKAKGTEGIVLTNATVNGAFLEFDQKVASSAFGSQGAETARLYLKEVDGNNNALAVKLQKAGNMVEVEITSPKAVCGVCGSKDGASDPTYDFAKGVMILDLWCGHSYQIPMNDWMRVS